MQAEELVKFSLMQIESNVTARPWSRQVWTILNRSTFYSFQHEVKEKTKTKKTHVSTEMFVNAVTNVCEEQLVLALGAVKWLATEVRLWVFGFCLQWYQYRRMDI